MDIADLAIKISEETDLVLGESIWLHNVPESHQEGVAVKVVRRFINHNELRGLNVAIFILFYNWATQSKYIDEIVDLMNGIRGTISTSWTPSGEIQVRDYGIDEHKRYVSAIMFNIKGD